MLQFGTGLSVRLRVLVTTTPAPWPSLGGHGGEGLRGDAKLHPHANPHLPKAFIEMVEGLYVGTRLGRQELEGELLLDIAGHCGVWRGWSCAGSK